MPCQAEIGEGRTEEDAGCCRGAGGSDCRYAGGSGRSCCRRTRGEAAAGCYQVGGSPYLSRDIRCGAPWGAAVVLRAWAGHNHGWGRGSMTAPVGIGSRREDASARAKAAGVRRMIAGVNLPLQRGSQPNMTKGNSHGQAGVARPWSTAGFRLGSALERTAAERPTRTICAEACPPAVR